MSENGDQTCCGIDPTDTVELPAFALAALACRPRACSCLPAGCCGGGDRRARRC